MHVSERWQDLASDLDLVGVAAGAPPSQFALLSAFLQGSDYQGYLVMAAASMAATYDELDLATVMNPANAHLLTSSRTDAPTTSSTFSTGSHTRSS